MGFLDNTEDKVNFLIDILVEKEILTKNCSTWIKAVVPLGLKTDFFNNSEDKKSCINLMDNIDYENYIRIQRENLICDTCKTPIRTASTKHFYTHICSNCGNLSPDKVTVNTVGVNKDYFNFINRSQE